MDRIDIEVSDHLTQKDIVQLLLHNAQHMVTREEVKFDIGKVEENTNRVEISLREDILRVEENVSRIEISLKEDILRTESSIREDVGKIETSLREEISRVETSLKEDIKKVDSKFDRLQWLIIATILSVFLKDYILEFFK
ncbi:MAG: hypothetical protein JJW00_00590 [Sulfurimonas sp.]|nr:hypothetical protein [Sulfurimonas sp.]